MIKELLKESQSYINHFFETVSEAQFKTIIDLCSSHSGLLMFTGVGKSGFIAEKIAATLTATGTKAIFLPPSNFLHGDIGILSENDVVIMISKSGESDEILDLVPAIHRKKARLVGVVSNSYCRLAKLSHTHIVLPVKKELCDFDLVPTTSAAVQLIFGDILAVALMRNKKFNLEDYILNHPAGTIGKKMTLSVNDLMISGTDIPVCSPKDKLGSVLVELSKKECGALLVTTEDDQLRGIFTDGDLRRSIQSFGSSALEKNMEEIMTPSAVSVPSESLAWDAMREMQKDPKKWVMVTPVVEKGKVVGILRMHDIIQSGIV